MRKKRLLTLAAVFAVVVLFAGAIQLTYPPTPGWWTGHNTKLSQYYIAPGYPPYPAHPRYLGTLSGSWHDIGVQYGQKAGDFIRYVYEGWYKELIAAQYLNQNIVDYVHQENAYYKNLSPEALQLIAGIAEGAKQDLDQSIYANKMTNFEKILMINSYFGLQGKPPVGPIASVSRPGDPVVRTCSGAVIFGKATRDGKLIHVSSEDQHFFPQEYLVTYIVHPGDPNAHTYTVTASAGEIGSQHAINDKGVVVSGYAGGGIGIASPTFSAPFSGYRRPGLDWQLGSFYADAFSSTAEEAVQRLTVGTPEYRQKSGYKIVIGKCTKGANWVVSDLHHAYVVESIPADQNGVARYAVRKPGEMGEIGANYIVSTNNVEANYSCDENNLCSTDHPMSQHGNSTQNPNYFGLSGSGQRFWTFMWLINNNYGQITPDMVKQWRKTHFFIDKSGVEHDTLVYTDGKSYPTYLTPGAGTLCRHTTLASQPGVDQFTGINIYVSLSTPDNLTVYRTKGRPCEWVGPWDALSLPNGVPPNPPEGVRPNPVP